MQKRTLSVATMVKMQEQLNDVYIPGWRELLSPSDYLTQLVAESVELLDSGFTYKWWKDVPVDQLNLWNARIEVVDMMFFYMSMAALMIPASKIEEFGKLPTDIAETDRLVSNKEDNTIQHRIYANILSDIFNQYETGMGIGDFLNTMDCLAGLLEMTAEEVAAVYTVKYSLNLFRISSGYKSGSYKKVVDGIEDNERLRYLVEEFLSNQDMTLDDLRTNAEESFFQPT